METIKRVLATTSLEMNKNLEKHFDPDPFLLPNARRQKGRRDVGAGSALGGGAGRPGRILKLDLAGGEGLVLHDHGAAGGQNHDVELLLLLVRLLVPVAGHLRVVGGDEGHLKGARTTKHLFIIYYFILDPIFTGRVGRL